MKALTTLIKISKAQLDEKRKELNVYLNQKQVLIDKIVALEDSIKYEAENLDKTPDEFRAGYISFVFGCRKQEELILNQIDMLNPAINKLTDEINRLFSEMKKYEIVKENRIAELTQTINRKRQLEIDGMAVMNHVKKMAEAEATNK